MRVLLAFLLLLGLAQAAQLYGPAPIQRPWKVSSDKIDLTQSIPMSIGLKRKNMDKVDKLFWEVSDPRHENYGEHLGHEAVRQLISQGPAAIAVVQKWLEQSGAKKITLARHEDYIKFEATLAVIEKMLQVKFLMFKNEETGQKLPRAVGTITIPDVFANIIEVIGGHRGFPMPRKVKTTGTKHHRGMKKQSAKNTIATGIFSQRLMSPQTNVTPSKLYEVYNMNEFPTTPTGKTNVQSFFQAQGQYVNNSDLASFCQQLMGGTFEHCHIDKYIGPNQPGQPGLESELDSQYITATSRASETWVYSFSSMDFCGDLMSWAQDVFSEASGVFPHVISMSYGSQSLPNYCLGPDVDRLSQDIQKMGLMGISVMIASGDSGSGEDSRMGYNYGLLAPSMPASIPYCTAVGATTFLAGNDGQQIASQQFGSGGGFSYDYAQPSYQTEAVANFFKTSTKLPPPLSYNASGRGTPDVSGLGEGYQVLSGGSFEGVGGTSCSTPMFSGMVTLLNNIRLENNKTLGFLNPLLYQHPEGFTDIVGGNNDVNSDGYGWYCTKGWDPATGLGTPNFGNLASIVRALNAKERARKN